MFFQVITFGCKLNQAESDQISADLISLGFAPSSGSCQPNLIIFNVCAVTVKAARESRQAVSFGRRKYPQAKIIVAGCFTEDNWPGVDLWVKNDDKDRLGQIVKKYLPIELRACSDSIAVVEKRQRKTRALVKIQTGCNNACSFCIVPCLRGPSISRDPREIIEEISKKAKQGYKEIVLTGVNIGLYQFLNFDLTHLIKLILQRTMIERLRLSSLWPTAVNSKLIKLMAAHHRLCPHLHLSVQSGSDKILKSMGRHYRAQDILKITALCRRQIPLINFTADIIVGFPGETEDDFQATKNLIKKIGFSKVHIFKYSPRPGTRALSLPDHIDMAIKQARSRELFLWSDQIGRLAFDSFIGQQLNILWENKIRGYWSGYTENYLFLKQKVRAGVDKNNTIESIRVK